MSWNPKIIKVIKICASFLGGVVVLGLMRINYFQNLAQTIGGLVILLGVYFAWRNLQLAEDGKITDRYSNAVAQLANQNMTVRIGGIYALERIARGSQKDHWTVMEALCAFIRDESNKVATTAQAAEQPPTSENGDQQATDSKNDTEQDKLRSDIQIALTVIGRRFWVDKEREQGLRLNLTGTDLSGADLTRAKLSGAGLYKANLYEADLRGANLTRANLNGADLRGANLLAANLTRANLFEAFLIEAKLMGADLYAADLTGADLSWAMLVYANLGGANLTRAYLSNADLRGANLIGAFLNGANLTEANLGGTNLTRANLNGADLRGAEYNKKTKFPEGFDLARLKPDTNEGTE